MINFPVARAALCAIALSCAAHVTGAQAFTGIAAVDSAAAARAAWADAVKASRARDTQRAREAVERAATAWPSQPTYAWSRTVLAAAAGDTVAVERSLRAYAALGLGRALTDTVFDRFRKLPWFAEVESLHRGNLAPVSRSRAFATLSDSSLFPEGIDVNPENGKLYVTSIRHGRIVEVSPDGGERVVWPRSGVAATGAVLGVRVDPRRDRVWATVAAIPQWAEHTAADSSSALLEIRIADGSVLRRYAAPPGRHLFGDLAVTSAGDVYVSDAGEPALYHLRPSGDSLETFRHPLFRSLQGIAPTRRPGELYVADYSHGLLHVQLNDRVVSRLEDASGSTSLGIDGLQWVDGALIGIQNGVAPARVTRFELDAGGRRITGAYVLDRRADAGEPTSGTLRGEELIYVANSHWQKYGPDGRLRPGVTLDRPTLLAVPLARPR